MKHIFKTCIEFFCKCHNNHNKIDRQIIANIQKYGIF